MNPEQKKSEEKLTVKEFFSLGDVGRYFFRSKEEKKQANVNTRIMHGINRLAIIIFLAGAIFIIFRYYIL